MRRATQRIIGVAMTASKSQLGGPKSMIRRMPRPRRTQTSAGNYVATTVGQKEVPFKLTDTKTEGPDQIFTFTNGANAFPQVIIYRRATDGWLYVEVGGKQAGKDQKVIYPFRRLSCETGEYIRR